MTGRRPLQVVTVTGRSVRAVRKEIDAARLSGADLVEIRFDRWSPAGRRRAGELFPSAAPLVATYRSRTEGGAGADDRSRRAATLSALAEHPFAYLDLEAARDRPLEAMAASRGVKVVRSTHVVGPVDLGALRSAVTEAPPDGGLVKVVIPATLEVLVRDLLPLVDSLADPRPIVLATGPAGPLWRGWAARLGLPWVYSAPPAGMGSEPVERSQLPVDRLASFFAAPDAPIFAVVGHPVAHSLSPDIHHAWMRRAAQAGLYVPLDLSTESEMRAAVRELPPRGVRGLNVTHPWKGLAFELAGERSEAADVTRQANCLTFTGSAIRADNTDLSAIERRLAELSDEGKVPPEGLSVLGTGGAAQSTLAAARSRHLAATVYGRSTPRTDEVAARYGARAGRVETASPTGLLVHATTVGRAGSGPLGLPLTRLVAPGGHVVDWVYGAEVPVVAEAARAAGATYEDGRRLLVYQAALSYRAWWGEGPDAASVADVLREVGCTA